MLLGSKCERVRRCTGAEAALPAQSSKQHPPSVVWKKCELGLLARKTLETLSGDFTSLIGNHTHGINNFDSLDKLNNSSFLEKCRSSFHHV